MLCDSIMFLKADLDCSNALNKDNNPEIAEILMSISVAHDKLSQKKQVLKQSE